MNRNEYFFVFEAIIYGLALAEMLTGLNKMIEARKTIKIYWAHLTFVLMYILILITNYCWQFYRNPFDLVDTPFTFIIFVAIYPISFFFAAYQGFPKQMEGVDFKEYFRTKKKEILIAAWVAQIAFVIQNIAFTVYTSSFNQFFNTKVLQLSDFWLQITFVPLIAFAMFSKKLWPSEMMAILTAIAQGIIVFIQFKS